MIDRLGACVWTLLVVASCTKAGSDDPPVNALPAATAEAKPKLETSKVVYVNGPADGFDAAIAEHVAAAGSAGLWPYLEFSADWCKPCVEFKRYIDDPMMRDAMTGVYLIIVDFDTFSAEAQAFGVQGIPTWIELDPSGQPTARRITSSVWGEDIPANMAPPLDAFFHPKR
jgi:thiol-disulfide isomerase/thioredoxin